MSARHHALPKKAEQSQQVVGPLLVAQEVEEGERHQREVEDHLWKAEGRPFESLEHRVAHQREAEDHLGEAGRQGEEARLGVNCAEGEVHLGEEARPVRQKRFWSPRQPGWI